MHKRGSLVWSGHETIREEARLVTCCNGFHLESIEHDLIPMLTLNLWNVSLGTRLLARIHNVYSIPS